MKMGIAKYIRVRCSYCGKVVRSDDKGCLICARNRDKNNEVKSYMTLYEVKTDKDRIMNFVGFTCPYCGTNIVSNVDMNKAKYK